MKTIVILFCLVACALCQEDNTFSSQQACSDECNGSRDSCVASGLSAFKCVCQPGYFRSEDKDLCKKVCEEQHWSWFTYNGCSREIEELGGQCTRTCAFRIRVWAIVFIIVMFAAAVALLVFILPMCIATCKSCLMIKKEKKIRKKGGGPGGVAVVDGGENRDVVPAKSMSSQQQAMYNPYMYWPYYGRM